MAASARQKTAIDKKTIKYRKFSAQEKSIIKERITMETPKAKAMAHKIPLISLLFFITLLVKRLISSPSYHLL